MEIPRIAFLFVLFCALSSATGTPPFWAEITQLGAVPPGLWNGGSAYDPNDDRFYIFGGLSGTFPLDFPVNSFYKFDPSTNIWTHLAPTTDYVPAERAEAVTWVDKKSRNVFVAGGRGRFRTGTDLTQSDTWAFDTSDEEWYKIPQTDDRREIANRSAEAVTDKKGRPLVFSGTRSTLSGYINRPGAIQPGIASFKANGWIGWQTVDNDSPASESPRGRNYHAIGYSNDAKALFIYGGYTSDQSGGTGLFTENNYLGDLWRFDENFGEWFKFPASAVSPGKRDNMKMVVDDQNDRIWLYGGADWTGKVYNDLWMFQLSTSTWTKVLNDLDVANAPPVVGPFWFVRETAASYQLFIFGGSSSDQGTSVVRDKMWKLTIPFNYQN